MEDVAPDALINKDDGRKYWDGVDADDNGMLGGLLKGGFSNLSRLDLQGSRTFLAKLGIGAKPPLRVVGAALEGGAGVGRVTNGLMVNVAKEVDIIEPTVKFTDAIEARDRVRTVFNVGLEEWKPRDETRYDLVWVQWCVGHLTDDQLVEFLKRCQSVLNAGGFIALKENLSTSGVDLFDDLDSSVTREESKFQDIFKSAGLRVSKTELQKAFPSSLFPVRMWALTPE